MSNRDEILAAIRKNQPAPRPLPDVPLFDTNAPPALKTFRASLERMGGKIVEAHGDLAAFVAARFPDAKVIVSATSEVTGTRPLPSVKNPRELDDVDVGVVRAGFAVAETGSVYLSEAELGVNALAYLPQHLVVLLDPAHILPNLHHAYHRPEFQEAKYASLTTGSSATADIQGILIHGAQGVRSLTVLLAPRP